MWVRLRWLSDLLSGARLRPKSTTAHNSTRGPPAPLARRPPRTRAGYDLAGLQQVPADGTPAPRDAAGTGSRTLRNTILILTARVVSRVLALGAYWVQIRYLQPTGLGIFQDVVNQAALATVFLDVGFNTLFQREAARR